MDDDDRRKMAESAENRLALLVQSFAQLSGNPLVGAAGTSIEEAAWFSPRAIVAHGMEQVPLFFYANKVALELFETSATQFIGLPSHKSAEPGERAEREMMLAKLQSDDIVGDYAGVRVSSTGRRFRIERAHIWNIIDLSGVRHGQAATFSQWTFLRPS